MSSEAGQLGRSLDLASKRKRHGHLPRNPFSQSSFPTRQGFINAIPAPYSSSLPLFAPAQVYHDFFFPSSLLPACSHCPLPAPFRLSLFSACALDISLHCTASCAIHSSFFLALSLARSLGVVRTDVRARSSMAAYNFIHKCPLLAHLFSPSLSRSRACLTTYGILSPSTSITVSLSYRLAFVFRNDCSCICIFGPLSSGTFVRGLPQQALARGPSAQCSLLNAQCSMRCDYIDPIVGAALSSSLRGLCGRTDLLM